MIRRRGAHSWTAPLVALAVLATGCFELGDDTTGTTTTTTTAATTDTTAAPVALTTWPAGVVWGDFADDTTISALPDDGVSRAVATATGPAGTVAVGRFAASSGAEGTTEDLSGAMIWYRDGDTWQLADSTGLPNGTSALYDVAAWSGGFVAVGFHADAYRRHASAVVLTSVDGRTWRLASDLPSIWSGYGSRVRVTDAGAVLVEVSMTVCTDDALFVNSDTDSLLTVPELWVAASPTATYDQLPTGTLAALSPPRPTPSDAGQCLTDFASVPEDERAAAFGAELGDIAAVGGRLAVLEPDATAVSITSDLSGWTQVALPDPPEQPLGSMLFADANGKMNVVTVSARPLGEGYVDGAVDPDSWVSTAWVEVAENSLQRVEPWRPLYTLGLTFQRLELRDGVVRLVAQAMADAPGAPPVLRVAESSPSAPLPPPTCAPASLADCNFVTLDGAQLAGADLGGIELYGATVTNSDLSGTNLAYAQLSRASILNTSLAGADVNTARLQATRISGSNLTSTVLAYADLSAATLVGTTMTGANLLGARTEGTTVDATSTCPDGAAPTAGTTIIAQACRLT